MKEPSKNQNLSCYHSFASLFAWSFIGKVAFKVNSTSSRSKFLTRPYYFWMPAASPSLVICNVVSCPSCQWWMRCAAPSCNHTVIQNSFPLKPFLLLQEPGKVPHICASLEDNITDSISSITPAGILASVFCLPLFPSTSNIENDLKMKSASWPLEDFESITEFLRQKMPRS